MITKLPKITTLGYGGAFDTAEGNSSFLFSVEGQQVLLDCGFTVYSRLKNRSAIEDIDLVCVTHTHDDHVGSLSALIYHRWFLLQKATRIVATMDVLEKVRDFLTLLGHTSEQVRFNTRAPGVEPFSTSGLHMKDMPSCGFRFQMEDGINFIFSGDIGCPVTQALSFRELKPESTIIFHDATAKADSTVHCPYQKLETLAQAYTLYAYHHGEQEEVEILDKSDYINTINLYPNA